MAQSLKILKTQLDCITAMSKSKSVQSCIFLITVLSSIWVLIQYFGHYLTAWGFLPKAGTLPTASGNDSVTLTDLNLKLEVFATGLHKPTNMAFLDNGDALVLEKQNGKVIRIVNGSALPTPLLDASVATFDTRGMLGIAVTKNQTRGVQYVFLYFTQAGKGLGDGQDRCLKVSNCIDSSINQPTGNVLCRYEISPDGMSLKNEKLLLNISAMPGATHNGGEMVIGPDNNIYIIIGNAENRTTPANNSMKNPYVDGKGGILALDHEGKATFTNGILGSDEPLNKYYAYGIRNGFGLDFDPVSGNLWDTENGPEYGDEINLVQPGFNSGFRKIMGFWTKTDADQLKLLTRIDDHDGAKLVDFGGKGKYSSPELAWNETVAPTAIRFLNSDKYGEKYEDDAIVGSNLGYVFHFYLKSNRTELELNGSLKDRIASNRVDEMGGNILGQGFDSISDITVGPDGYMYIVSFGKGQIYRVIPRN